MKVHCYSLLLISVLPLPALAQPAAQGALSGQLVDAVTGNPIAGATVWAYAPDADSPDAVTSGPDGRFSWNNLAEGRYSLQTIISGESISLHEFSDGSRLAYPVGPGKESVDVVFPVRHHPSICGSVRDEFGDALAGVNITVYRRNWRDGGVVFDQVSVLATDDKGRFHFIDLLPAAYILAAEVDRLAPESGVGDFQARDSQRRYSRQLYPGEPPATFALDWDQNREIVLTLHSVIGIPVSGHVNGANIPYKQVHLVRDDGTESSSALVNLGPDGAFQLTALDSGRYRVEATGVVPVGAVQHISFATRAAVVEATGAKGIEMALQDAGTLETSVRLPNGAEDAENSVQLGLRPAGQTTRKVIWAYPGSDGKRVFSNLAPGGYWLVLRHYGSYCAASAKLAGKEVLHERITVSPGMSERIEISLSDQCASIEGRIVFHGKAAPFARFAFLLSGSAKSPGDVFVDYSSADGAYEISKLPPGRYSLWAWNSEDPNYPGPALLSDLEGLATTFVVASGQQIHGGTVRVLQEVLAK